MTKRFIGHIALGFAALFLCASHLKADTVDSMQLTSAGSNVDYNVAIGPYTALVNGVSTQVICDDFSDETYVGETWSATVSNFPSLSSVKFDPGSANTAARTLGYDEISWLSIQLLNSKITSQEDAIQFAIWSVFDPSGVSNYLKGFSGGTSFDTDSANTNGVQYWLNLAASQTYTSDEFSNVIILTPDSNYPMSCKNNWRESCPPQEFITVTTPPVKTPEPGTLALLGLGLVSMLFVTKRRRVTANDSLTL